MSKEARLLQAFFMCSPSRSQADPMKLKEWQDHDRKWTSVQIGLIKFQLNAIAARDFQRSEENDLSLALACSLISGGPV